MTGINPQDAMQLLGIVLTAGFSAGAGAVAAYVAIRSDLAAIRAVQEIHGASLTRAHDRIDNLQGGSRSRG